jgi:hypothetical protein
VIDLERAFERQRQPAVIVALQSRGQRRGAARGGFVDAGWLVVSTVPCARPPTVRLTFERFVLQGLTLQLPRPAKAGVAITAAMVAPASRKALMNPLPRPPSAAFPAANGCALRIRSGQPFAEKRSSPPFTGRMSASYLKPS